VISCLVWLWLVVVEVSMTDDGDDDVDDGDEDDDDDGEVSCALLLVGIVSSAVPFLSEFTSEISASCTCSCTSCCCLTSGGDWVVCWAWAGGSGEASRDGGGGDDWADGGGGDEEVPAANADIHFATPIDSLGLRGTARCTGVNSVAEGVVLLVVVLLVIDAVAVVAEVNGVDGGKVGD
jgi:hypothetical protein